MQSIATPACRWIDAKATVDTNLLLVGVVWCGALVAVHPIIKDLPVRLDIVKVALCREQHPALTGVFDLLPHHVCRLHGRVGYPEESHHGATLPVVNQVGRHY
jgi:hypothetical protein